MRLENKIALVTGASRGIGRAAALALAKEGAHVVITARAGDELASLADEITALGRRALPVVADLIQPDDVQGVYDQTMSAFGRMDILVNNVGVGKFGTLDAYTIEDYDWMFDSNVKTSFLVTRLFLPGMITQKDGILIFVGSVAGMRGLPGEAIYSASKNAQRAFAEALDHECRPHNVKVSYLAPGGVNSFFAYGTGRTQGDPKLELMLDNEDVADAVIFAATQLPKSRVFLIGMRPMSESL